MSKLLTDAEIAEIEKRLAAASPGPWKRGERTAWVIYTDTHGSIMDEETICELSNRGDGPKAYESNGELIAHAPADMRKLLDENKELRRHANQMIASLRRLLGHKEVITTMVDHDGAATNSLCLAQEILVRLGLGKEN